MRWPGARHVALPDHEAHQFRAVRPTQQLLARVGLWGLVGLGGVGGVVGLVAGVSPPPAPAPVPAARSGDVPADVAGFAQLAVGAWLGAGPDHEALVDALFVVDPEPSPLATQSDRQLQAGRLAVVGAREVQAGYWAVTVAAEVDEFDERAEGSGSSRRLGTWFFEVGVVGDAEGHEVAVAEPAMVPAPTEPAVLPQAAGGLLVAPQPDDEAVLTAVEGFLRALLTGVGEVDRYTAPGLDLTAVVPVPFHDVEVDGIAVAGDEDDEVRVQVAVTATTAAGSAQSLGYELTLASWDGRWEVAAVSGAPTLADQTAGVDQQPAASSPGSTSSSPPSPPPASVAVAPGA